MSRVSPPLSSQKVFCFVLFFKYNRDPKILFLFSAGGGEESKNTHLENEKVFVVKSLPLKNCGFRLGWPVGVLFLSLSPTEPTC